MRSPSAGKGVAEALHVRFTCAAWPPADNALNSQDTRLQTSDNEYTGYHPSVAYMRKFIPFRATVARVLAPQGLPPLPPLQ
eukprot:scaffold46757_cov69-Phaeocystis_antarctica.AAC.1